SFDYSSRFLHYLLVSAQEWLSLKWTYLRRWDRQCRLIFLFQMKKKYLLMLDFHYKKHSDLPLELTYSLFSPSYLNVRLRYLSYPYTNVFTYPNISIIVF